MPAVPLKLQVEGMKEIRAAFKELGDGLPRELQQANKAVAEMIAGKARGAAEALGSTAGHVAESIVASGTQAAVAVILGRGHPEALGAEFGSLRFHQFPPFDRAGRFLYPTIRGEKDNIIKTYEDRVEALIRKAGL